MGGFPGVHERAKLSAPRGGAIPTAPGPQVLESRPAREGLQPAGKCSGLMQAVAGARSRVGPRAPDSPRCWRPDISTEEETVSSRSFCTAVLHAMCRLTVASVMPQGEGVICGDTLHVLLKPGSWVCEGNLTVPAGRQLSEPLGGPGWKPLALALLELCYPPGTPRPPDPGLCTLFQNLPPEPSVLPAFCPEAPHLHPAFTPSFSTNTPVGLAVASQLGPASAPSCLLP